MLDTNATTREKLDYGVNECRATNSANIKNIERKKT